MISSKSEYIEQMIKINLLRKVWSQFSNIFTCLNIIKEIIKDIIKDKKKHFFYLQPILCKIARGFRICNRICVSSTRSKVIVKIVSFDLCLLLWLLLCLLLWLVWKFENRDHKKYIFDIFNLYCAENSRDSEYDTLSRFYRADQKIKSI